MPDHEPTEISESNQAPGAADYEPPELEDLPAPEGPSVTAAGASSRIG